MGWGNESLFKRSWSHDQDGRHAHVIRPFCWHKNFVPWGLSAPARELYTCIKWWKKLYKIRLQITFFWNLQQINEVTRHFYWHQNFVPWGLSAPALGLYKCIKIMKKIVQNRTSKRFFFKLVANDWSDKGFLLTSKFCPLRLSAPDLWLNTFIKSWKDVYKVRGWRDSF